MLNLPPAETIEECSEKVCYHMVANDAFPLTNNIIKPYPHKKLDKSKCIFNCRLSRARRVVENAFGILANRFRVFLTTINLDHQKVNDILAACCLHNVLVENNKHNSISCQEFEDTENQQFTSGQWKKDICAICKQLQ